MVVEKFKSLARKWSDNEDTHRTYAPVPKYSHTCVYSLNTIHPIPAAGKTQRYSRDHTERSTPGWSRPSTPSLTPRQCLGGTPENTWNIRLTLDASLCEFRCQVTVILYVKIWQDSWIYVLLRWKISTHKKGGLSERVCSVRNNLGGVTVLDGSSHHNDQMSQGSEVSNSNHLLFLCSKIKRLWSDWQGHDIYTPIHSV